MLNKNKLVLLGIPIVIFVIFISINSNQQTEDEIQDRIIKNESVEDNFEVNQEKKSYEELLLEVEEKYAEIENNDGIYTPTKRTWPSSGPFKIDREQYVLGEKIFMIAEGIDFSENGEIIFLRPLNSTHFEPWKVFNFDGMKKNAFNIYFEPSVSKINGICSGNDLIGNWMVIFNNTGYKPIKFSILNNTIPGDEGDFMKVC